MKNLFVEIYDRLLEKYGFRNWWPGETPFEITVGAVLTQNTAWANVEKAILNLKSKSLLTPEGINLTEEKELAELIRPAGYYNVKAKRLKNLVRFLMDEGGGDPRNLRGRDPDLLRKSLLNISGIGHETADSILLYAIGMPFFVVDAYTRRIFGRIGLIDPRADYEVIRKTFEASIPRNVMIYNDYHAQIVEHGKRVCKKTPHCQTCVLIDLCEAGKT